MRKLPNTHLITPPTSHRSSNKYTLSIHPHPFLPRTTTRTDRCPTPSTQPQPPPPPPLLVTSSTRPHTPSTNSTWPTALRPRTLPTSLLRMDVLTSPRVMLRLLRPSMARNLCKGLGLDKRMDTEVDFRLHTRHLRLIRLWQRRMVRMSLRRLRTGRNTTTRASPRPTHKTRRTRRRRCSHTKHILPAVSLLKLDILRVHCLRSLLLLGTVITPDLLFDSWT